MPRKHLVGPWPRGRDPAGRHSVHFPSAQLFGPKGHPANFGGSRALPAPSVPFFAHYAANSLAPTISLLPFVCRAPEGPSAGRQAGPANKFLAIPRAFLAGAVGRWPKPLAAIPCAERPDGTKPLPGLASRRFWPPRLAPAPNQTQSQKAQPRICHGGGCLLGPPPRPFPRQNIGPAPPKNAPPPRERNEVWPWPGKWPKRVRWTANATTTNCCW